MDPTANPNQPPAPKGPPVGPELYISATMSVAVGSSLGAVPGSASSSAPGDLPPLAEQEIGPYKIVQLIGEGGFGYVYLAQQSQPVRRRVALKVLKPGMDSKQVLSRFESERHSLALMDHPNISRVLDAGTTPLGRPFFVMELVKGVPITEYCDGSNLPTRERLELFISVCQALQHAHQKGIIHRDIKPSNVLVTLQDDRPVVKVIDFGIAKAINQDAADEVVTQFRQFIGTPTYMSPEQASMTALDIDTRTDVYSLGVLLYELIAGSTPIEPGQLRGDIASVQKFLREYEPPRPSTRIASATRAPAAATASGSASSLAAQIARNRRTDPAALRDSLKGELDWIVMKCLEKDRRRRYDSAAALADDIQRYLTNQPIQARPASPLYLARKFTARNRLAIGAAGGVLAGLILTLVALAYGLHEAKLERDKTAERETITRAQMLLSSMNAVRAYTVGFVRPALTAGAAPGSYGEFKPEMVPAFGARRVFEKFRDNDDYRGFIYKEAGTNPTNPADIADDFEKQLLTTFRAERAKTELAGTTEINGKRHFYIARPMVIKDAACLDCHTTPDKAPPRQVELYGKDGGYGWSMGEVIAAQVVYVPVTEAFRAEAGSAPYVLGGLLTIFIVGGIGAFVVLRRV